MPSKYYNRNFKSQYFYHILNRGAYKHKIFIDEQDYETFLSILEYYLTYPCSKFFGYTKLVSKPYKNVKVTNLTTIHLVAYCLMPNHFHFIFKQLPSATKKTNISNLMRRLMITYAMYFQNRHNHEGAIFQGRYKNVIVDTSEQLVYLSKYIHKNPEKLAPNLENYTHSSYPSYINKVLLQDYLHPEYVLKLQRNYQKFVESPLNNKAEKKINPLILE
ncbi:MAG: transposase [Candidatus Beckwithbacteria bacterium]|nr:transposase [Patescibacteria group bacterium]